jgi:hypothetical protein
VWGGFDGPQNLEEGAGFYLLKARTFFFRGGFGKAILKRAQETKAMEFLRDLWGFMRTRKKYWLIPIIIILLLFGLLIVLTSGSAIAPFIYTLF